MVQKRNSRRGFSIPRSAVLAAALAFAAPALATTDTKEDASKGEHGAAPAATETSPTQQTTEAGLAEATNLDKSLGTGAPLSLDNRFRFDVGWELHALAVQNNLVGNGAETVYNYFFADATYYITKNDRLLLYAGLYQFALADPGESGWRADDILLRYTHHFKLPWKVGLDLAGSAIAPTSFESYKMGLVTEPQIRALFERTFFKHITVDLRLSAAYYWQTYTTVQGGSSPNPIAQAGGVLSIEAELPWHPALALGVDMQTAYVTYYNPAGQPGSISGVPGNQGASGPYYGLETNPTFSSQPVQQIYGFDVYLRYDFPKFKRAKVSLELAYANGQPYTAEQIDGVSNLFLFYPESSQFFSSVTVKY